MQIGVTATTSTGAKFWLTAPNSGGALGTQTNAQIFEKRDDALGAIAQLPGDFISAGNRVSVEPLDADARIDCRS